MSDTTDIDKHAAKVTSRVLCKVTSRVLWGAGFVVLALVLCAPLAARVVVDRAGHSFWSQVQSTLKADGEATTLTELARPIIGPRDENYGAIVILENIAGDAGKANREMLNSIFPESADVIPVHLTPSPCLPPVDLADWADFLWTGVEKEYAQSFAIRKRNHTERLPNPIHNKGTPSERIENYLNHWKPTISKLREGIYRKQAYFEPQIDSRDWEYPKFRSMAHLGPVRSAARVCYLHALLAARSGDRETCLIHLEAISRLAEATANEQDLNAYIYSAQMMILTETGIAEGFRNRLWQNDPASVERCQTMLKRVNLREALGPSLRDHILSDVDFFAWLATRQGRRYLTANTHPDPLVRLLPHGWIANQQGIYAGSANFHLFSALRKDAHFGEMLEAAKHFDADLNRCRDWQHSLITAFKPMDGIYYSLLWTTYVEAHRRQALIACAIELHRIEHNREAPASLADLVPTFLDEIPADPMDGAPMRYVQTSPTTYQLWSIALDRIDDGGKLNLTPNRGQNVAPSFHNYTGDWPWPSIP